MKKARMIGIAVLIVAGGALLGVGATLGLQNDESVRKLSAVKLPNVPGQTLTRRWSSTHQAENPVFTITPAASSRTY